ncbi:MAG: hypothetical protein GEV08_14250 [Acidimicrobiia bacterium]|nr:hypothetical protein [Acidimicrobiia bacterium]
MQRGPVLVLVGLLLAAAAWVRDDDGTDVAADLATELVPADLAPVASEEGSSSTWFCAGGTAAAGGAADHVVTVTNTAGSTVAGTIQVFPVRAEPLAPVPIEVPAASSTSVRIGDLVAAEYAAAQVEVQEGPVVVHHEVTGPGSTDIARCATRASATWYLPWGQTTLGSTLRLALFNPFPGDAVVDVTFDTEDGFRRPEAYQAMLVRSRQLVVLNVEEVVTRRQRVSAQVVARSGRLVVDRVQTVTAGEATAVEVGGGAPGAADAWYFPEGRVDPSAVEAFYVYNPSDRAADVELTVLTGSNDPATQPEPFQIRLAPGAASELVLNREPRIAQPLVHATSVQASSDVPIVVERLLASGPFSAVVAPDLAPASASTYPAGIDASLGSPLLATSWVTGPVPRAGAGALSVVSVLNPGGSGDVEVRVTGLDGAPVGEPTVLGAGQRAEVQVSGASLVEADGPVVAGQLWVFPEPASFATEPAVAWREEASVAEPVTSFAGGPVGGGAPTAPTAAPTESTVAPTETTTSPTG